MSFVVYRVGICLDEMIAGGHMSSLSYTTPLAQSVSARMDGHPQLYHRNIHLILISVWLWLIFELQIFKIK